MNISAAENKQREKIVGRSLISFYILKEKNVVRALLLKKLTLYSAVVLIKCACAKALTAAKV